MEVEHNWYEAISPALQLFSWLLSLFSQTFRQHWDKHVVDIHVLEDKGAKVVFNGFLLDALHRPEFIVGVLYDQVSNRSTLNLLLNLSFV